MENLNINKIQNNKTLLFWLLLIRIFALGITFRWEALEVVRLNQWLARDKIERQPIRW
tara:strand:+ start:160 stop:333 length:174 start_codon:yes stop_codon:yes gene_type:complete